LNYGLVLAAVMLAALGIAALVATRLQQAITRPLQSVTNVAREVMQRRDFSLRVPGQGSGEIGVLVAAFNDMLAEIGRRSDALQQANRTLEHEMHVRERAEDALRVADKRKDEFLATLAHELRNPLAPIRTGLDILRLRSGDAQATQRATDIMERQLRQMVRLVDDLLDVSRINTGKFAIKMGRVELKAVVNDALEVVRSYIELHGHELSIDLPDRPVFLHGDATRLAQILSNLLNNAAKYTNRGGKVSLSARVEEEKVLVLDVADNGIGIAPDMLDTVFEMFVQVDSTLERTNAGLGVGLSLARRLVELHGGSIQASSEGLGRGSRFTVRLPIVVEPELPTKPTPAAFISAETYRILLADDNVDFVNSIGALLSAMGHSVVITHNGPDALTAAARFCPDYAFLDIGLPQMSGYDLAREIRKLPCGQMTVMIAVTGWGQEKDRQLAFEAGFDHHMVKPVRFEQIEEILGNRTIVKKLRT
ncbi:MAG TPA: ATP-binding protein, partial [Telluria sp.]|nr:ATP-binding protein [Telluria sp.]